MVLIDNINILKAYNARIWDELRCYEEENNRVLFKLEESKKGDKTLALNKDGSTTYLHSKYNPAREAEAILESYTEIDENANIIFYGTGLGYHIKLILEKHPNIKYYIYEPIPELLHHFLSETNLKDFRLRRLLGIDIGLMGDSSMNSLVETNSGNFTIIEMPSHKQSFPEKYKTFRDKFVDIVKGKRTEVGTNYSFQKRWIINSIKNFKYVLSTPNIIIEKKGEFKGKKAILVAAGPSLNEEIENLRYIKENGLAYIFSVGSAINTLIHHGIYPDAATTYDPTERNQIVFETTKQKGIREIPMIFGSSVGYETLLDYRGEKYHMITSQDTISDYYLKNKEEQSIDIINDAPSIAVVTIQLLSKLGFDSIILVGQNLAYRGKERHSESINYSSEVSEIEIEKGIWIKDVSGKEILTDEGYNNMRKQMEYYIEKFPNIQVINTTKGGANIEGTTFVELEKVIKKHLKERVVKEDWLKSQREEYSKEDLTKQVKLMDTSYQKALKINKGYQMILDQIDKLIGNRNFNQAEKMYIKLDKELQRIEKNEYYQVFILPMNRVQYKILAYSIDRLNEVRDPYEKGKGIVENFGNFINTCNEDIMMIEPIYDEMKEDIVNYTKVPL